MRFLNWYLGPLKKYAVIEGRASRKEYWLFLLISVSVVWAILDEISSLIGIVYLGAIWLPMMAVTVRRLHDTNRRGRWVLLNLVPFVGLIVLFWMVIKGTDGDNDYGPDPLSRSKPQTLMPDETGWPPCYSLQGIGTAICWVSGIALLPLGIATVAEFRQVGIVTDVIDRPSLIDQSSFMSNWYSVEDTGLSAFGSAVLLGLAAFVLLVIWSWRASKNIQTWEKQSGRDVRRGAGWAIGGWFIPFGNLCIPYQTIQDAWRRAPLSDGSWQGHHDPPRNNAWLICWLTWVIAIPLCRFGVGNWIPIDTLSGWRTFYFLAACSNILLAASVISLIIAVRQIGDRHAPSGWGVSGPQSTTDQAPL